MTGWGRLKAVAVGSRNGNFVSNVYSDVGNFSEHKPDSMGPYRSRFQSNPQARSRSITVGHAYGETLRLMQQVLQ